MFKAKMQEYMGHTVLGKTVADNFKTRKRRQADGGGKSFIGKRKRL